MDNDPPPSDLSPGPWISVVLFSALWIGALAVVIHWWKPAAAPYHATAYVHGIPGSVLTDADWLPAMKTRLTSHQELLPAIEAIAGRQLPLKTAELGSFRRALGVDVEPDAASGEAALVLRYAGDLPQAPVLVETLARRFAARQVPLPVAARRSTVLAQLEEAQGAVRQTAAAVERLTLRIEALQAALDENRSAVEASIQNADADPATLAALDRQQSAIGEQLVELRATRSEKSDHLESLRTESNRLADELYAANQQYQAWSDAQLRIELAEASPPGLGAGVWAVSLLVVLAMVSGGWALAWWGRGDRPLSSAHQARVLLGVPVLAVDWRR